MPDNLKSGIESLSGMDMSEVRVHRNSDKPAQLNAHAYAQGNDIHLAPGQEQHLPHEAWHVVQQRQGRVKPTMQMAGQQVNDDPSLESEADVMGGRALRMKSNANSPIQLMAKEAWLRRAKVLHKTCVIKQSEKNGSKKCTTAEATTLNQLQHAIGSHHGISQVTYNEMRASLDQMFDWVKGGQKDDLLT